MVSIITWHNSVLEIYFTPTQQVFTEQLNMYRACGTLPLVQTPVHTLFL